LLVGADGIGSVVRSWMWPTARPRYAGYTAWRAVTAPGAWRTHGGETWGRGTRFGVVPITDGRVYWFATANRPEGSGSGLSAQQRHDEVRELFSG
jgi:2-polyprenyl-6-methoxyphenol hydroxylase-like FAD-dependent oxidoreductase